jgi:hypothetical protein
MADVQVKLNALNSLHIAGKVTDVVKNSNGTKVHLKVSGHAGCFTLKVQLPVTSQAPKIGEFIHVVGNLRYSEDYKTYKVMASAFSYLPQDMDLNLIYLEGTVLSGSPKQLDDKTFELELAAFNISKTGEVFIMPIKVNITSASYTATNKMISQYDRYIVEGYLFKDDKILKIGAYHVKSAAGIYQSITL